MMRVWPSRPASLRVWRFELRGFGTRVVLLYPDHPIHRVCVKNVIPGWGVAFCAWHRNGNGYNIGHQMMD
eukprot:4418050-Amphidinium_carterae.4